MIISATWVLPGLLTVEYFNLCLLPNITLNFKNLMQYLVSRIRIFYRYSSEMNFNRICKEFLERELWPVQDWNRLTLLWVGQFGPRFASRRHLRLWPTTFEVLELLLDYPGFVDLWIDQTPYLGYHSNRESPLISRSNFSEAWASVRSQGSPKNNET